MVRHDENTDFYATYLVKMTDKMDAMHINGKFFSIGAKWMESFFM